MSEKTPIIVSSVPQPIGPYSQGVKYENLIFISGQIPLDPRTNNIVSNDVAAQTRQCLENIKNILEAAGVAPFNVLKTTIFLVSLEDFETVNKIYAEYFPVDPPARSTVQVSCLPRNARIEIEAIAYVPKPKAGVGLAY